MLGTLSLPCFHNNNNRPRMRVTYGVHLGKPAGNAARCKRSFGERQHVHNETCLRMGATYEVHLDNLSGNAA